VRGANDELWASVHAVKSFFHLHNFIVSMEQTDLQAS